MGDVEVFTWWASGGGLSSPFEPTSTDLSGESLGAGELADFANLVGVRLQDADREVNAPDPIFEDWSEYEPFSEKRDCGFAASVMTCMWSGLLGAFLLAALLTIIILVVQ